MVINHPIWLAVILLWIAALVILALVTCTPQFTKHRKNSEFNWHPVGRVTWRLSARQCSPRDSGNWRPDDILRSFLASRRVSLN